MSVPAAAASPLVARDRVLSIVDDLNNTFTRWLLCRKYERERASEASTKLALDADVTGVVGVDRARLRHLLAYHGYDVVSACSSGDGGKDSITVVRRVSSDQHDMAEPAHPIVAPLPFAAAPALIHYLRAQFETWLAIALPVDDQRLTCVVDMTDMPDAERFAVLMAFIGDGFSLIQEERNGRTICTVRHAARALRDAKKPKADADPIASPKWTKDEDTERSAGRQFRSIGKDLGLAADVVKQRYAELAPGPGRG